ncbi:aspartyl protease family protein [Gilliamella sp. M0364]|uniref:aspartyl protease family protein n=1 Tax=Gilliamella sp. M0364 TaxID=2751011 RepID=UPI0018DE0698|nr:aspartyl protease family protein [Gilliamella sp. M0364]MBI0156854.1 aspartyl protease family protein [Gilliamella sp. M0364]
MNKKILFLIMLFISHFAQSAEVTWDLNFDDKYNLPLIMMDFQGEQIAMTLDTGSKEALHLPMDLINKIPNKTENSEKIRSIDLSGGVTELKSFIVNKLELNSFTFNKVQVVEYKDWGLVISSDPTIDDSEDTDEDKPVIGLGLFDGYVLTINYPESNITISDDTSTDLNPNWVAIPFDLNGEGLVVNLSDGIKNYKMVLDTGATVSLIKQQLLSPQSITISDPEDDFKSISLDVNNVANDSVLPIIIDSFPNEFQSDGLLGADFLSKNRVKIDFKNKQMWIQPVAKK